jgi:hypothetical protein
LFLLISSSVWAADDDPEETYGMKNGRFWNQMGPTTDEYKAAFLRALMDGWTLRGMTKDSVLGKELIVWRPGPKATLADLIATLNSVYKETENQPLPIGWVVMGTFAVQRGETTRDLVFMALRKHLTHMMDGQSRGADEVNPIDVILQFRKK